MKKTIKTYITVILLVAISIFSCGCDNTKPVSERELLRLHIRADSNDEADQSVKLKVRDDVVAYLKAVNADVQTFDEAYQRISTQLATLKLIADERLKSEGMNYTSEVKLTNEYFPTRSYDGITFESGYYDALIINLGSGKGDNWWCVVYPPLCYLGASDDFVYKSKIAELIKKLLS